MRDRSKKVAAVEAGLKQAAEKKRKLSQAKKKQKLIPPIVAPNAAPAAPFEAPEIMTNIANSNLAPLESRYSCHIK